MLGSILASIGGSVGKYFGGGILSTIGRYAGRLAGNYLENKSFHRTQTIHRFTNVKDSFHIAKAEYGRPIPLVFGRMRVPGQIIWADQIIEKRNTSSTSSHFKNRNMTLERQTTALEYYMSFAMAICEGEIAEIGRVWLGDEPIDLSQYNFRLYKGDEAQLPDPLIAESSKEQVPAYRGLAYIVFKEIPLADFEDTIPTFSFEITRKSNIKQDASVEDLVKSMIIIPGSGEYVYDTKIQKKTILAPSGAEIFTTTINSHNHYNIANSIHSLNQLQMTCQNIKWVSPVVCWFGNSIDAKNCAIKPAVEFKDENLAYTEEWLVGGYNRQNAYEITKDNHKNPLYGGSVNDASVIRYLIELKQRNLKIMFYPMFFLDVPEKPWRGRVSSDPEYIRDFFQRKHGYNDFILHYAQVVKDHVDAFVIGSELIGLTKIRNGDKFPAVDELVELAQKVKQIVGSQVLVTYAADWSEYHHTDGGWFNLDPLWASPDIDFVGIDAYFPVTKTISSAITPEEIANGWISGEGYDYYIDYANNTQHPLEPEYAWKNIRYWWENTHTNPDGQVTQWQPRTKPVWFTEFGFPSIDKAPNQPNIFFDPKCIDGGVPRHSSGAIDFSIQRKAIRAFIEYWQAQEYIGEMFLWTWDARPYPAWPHTTVWRDGYLWEKGHWVNNKFGTSSLASILLEISNKCGINTDNIEVSTVDEPIEGLVFNNQITAINAINILRTSYFFDICASNKEVISFYKRGFKQEITVNSEEFLKLSDNSFVEEIEIPKEVTLSKIDLYFINQHKEYDTNYIYINNETNSYTSKALIRLPIAITEEEANKIGQIILKNASVEDKVIRFILNNSTSTLQLKPADFIILQHITKQYSIRIINIQIDNNRIIVIGIVDDRNSYFSIPFAKNKLDITQNFDDASTLVILDLPFALEDINTPYLAVYLQNNYNASLYTKLAGNLSDNWNRITNLKPTHSIGRVVNFEQSPLANIFIIDQVSEILVSADKLEKYASSEWQFAMVGEELVSFKNIEKIQDKLYKISYLTRGNMGTEEFINTHTLSEDFVIINSGVNILPVAKKLENQNVIFKSCNIEKSMTYLNKALMPLAPYITQQEIIKNKLHLKWILRLKNDGNWQSAEAETNTEFTILITDGDKVYEDKTAKNEIMIDISSLALSDNYQVSILRINN